MKRNAFAKMALKGMVHFVKVHGGLFHSSRKVNYNTNLTLQFNLFKNLFLNLFLFLFKTWTNARRELTVVLHMKIVITLLEVLNADVNLD